MDAQHLNQTDLATRWNMSRKTLEKWRWRNMGPRYLKLGSRVRYSIADIEAFEADKFLHNTTEEYLKKSQRSR